MLSLVFFLRKESLWNTFSLLRASPPVLWDGLFLVVDFWQFPDAHCSDFARPHFSAALARNAFRRRGSSLSTSCSYGTQTVRTKTKIERCQKLWRASVLVSSEGVRELSNHSSQRSVREYIFMYTHRAPDALLSTQMSVQAFLPTHSPFKGFLRFGIFFIQSNLRRVCMCACNNHANHPSRIFLSTHHPSIHKTKEITVDTSTPSASKDVPYSFP